MINYTTITTELLTLVGFRSTSAINLSTSLETTESGLVVNALPDVSLDVIQDAAVLTQNEEVSSGLLIVGNWYIITDISGGADFTTVGASATTVGVQFVATSTTPTWGTGTLETQVVIDYLNIVRNDEIQNVLKQFVSSLQKKLNVKEIKVDDKLIKQFGTVKKSQTESAKGFYFKLASSKTLKMVMKSISLQLDAVDTCRIYLYEVGVTAAVFQHDYTSKDNEVDFETLTGWETYFEDENNSGKEYLLLYYDYDSDNIQADIQLEEDTQFYINTDCFKSKHNNFVYFSPVIIPKSYWTWNAITSEYDIPNLENTTALNFNTTAQNGLNLDYNIVCDITTLLINNKAILARMLQYAYAERILNDAFVSTRSNRTKRNTEAESTNYANKYHALLHGENVATQYGIKWVGGEIERVVNNFKNFDCKCFNTNFDNGLRVSNSYQANYK